LASPNGTQAKTDDRETSVLESVSDGMSYEERSSSAFRALEAGHDPHSINQEYNKPFPAESDQAKGEPEEAEVSKQQPEDQDKPDGQGKGDKSDPEPDGKEPIDEQKLERFLAAKRILQRDQLTDADIEALGQDRAIELAASRAEAHAAIDRRFSQPKPKSESGDEDAPAQRSAETGDELEEIVTQISEYDDELAEKVKGMLSGSVEQLQTIQKEVAAQRFQVTVERVTGKYPELKDDATFNRVLDRAKILSQSPAYDSADAAFEDAAVLVLSPTREARAQDRLIDDNIRQRDGQIDADTAVDQEAKPMSQDERDSYAFELLGKGKTPAEVQAIIRKIPYPKS